MSRTYWNAEIETMAPAARRALESERLRAQIAYNCRTSPFYAAKLDEARVKPERIRSTDDFKFNVNLVILDFALRHGVLRPDDPEYLDVATGLHRPLD